MTSAAQHPWYIDFFTELPNALWRAAVTPAQTTAEVDFLERVALPAPGRVLDVACGSGRHALEFARRGHRVTGVDVSVEAIEFARATARAQDLRLDLAVGDMARLTAVDLTPGYRLITCLGNAFGYLPHEQTVQFLADSRGLVDPGGSLVIDTGFAAESLLPGLRMEEEPVTFGVSR